MNCKKKPGELPAGIVEFHSARLGLHEWHGGVGNGNASMAVAVVADNTHTHTADNGARACCDLNGKGGREKVMRVRVCAIIMRRRGIYYCIFSVRGWNFPARNLVACCYSLVQKARFFRSERPGVRVRSAFVCVCVCCVVLTHRINCNRIPVNVTCPAQDETATVNAVADRPRLE